jgi:hypothetical protein
MSVFTAASELSGSETKAQRDSRLVPQLLCQMLQSEDAETVHKALRVISDTLREDNTGYPQTIPETVVTLRRLLDRAKHDEADTRRLACEVLRSYRAKIAVPVLIEALADPYEKTRIEGYDPDRPADAVRYAAWLSADAALRDITVANPVEAPRRHDWNPGQREKVQAAWTKWYQANSPKPVEGKPELKHITIRGRYSGLIWGMINRDGSAMWTGFGPPYDDFAVKRLTLTERLTEKVLSAAESLGPQAENVKYFPYRGNPECVLVLDFEKGRREILFTDSAQTDPSDTVRDLFRLLWESPLDAKRSEPNGIPVTYRGPTEDTCSTGLHRTLPHLKSGSQFSFVGRYDEKSNMVRFLDPPWVHVTWHSNVLGDRLQQTFDGYITNLAELKGRKPKDNTIARFRAAIVPNEPDLDYHEKRRRKIPHFNLELHRDFEVIPVTLSQQDLLQILKAQVSANRETIESFCRKVGVPHVFDPDGEVPGPSSNVKYTWYDGKLAVSCVVSPLPVSGGKLEKRKFVRMSALVAPDSGEVREIILAEKLVVYPRD